MLAPELTELELAALPPRHSRLACHAVGLAAVAAVIAYQVALMRQFGSWRPMTYPHSLVSDGIPVLVMFPFFRRVGMNRWIALVAGLLIPLVPLFLAWFVGFRLASLPYRDWRPLRSEFARIRRVPSTGYYVVLPRLPPTSPTQNRSQGEPTYGRS